MQIIKHLYIQMIRENEDNHILMHISHQYIVDMYAKIEKDQRLALQNKFICEMHL